jgi:aldose 1-epimerase
MSDMPAAGFTRARFGRTPDGTSVDMVTLTNVHGIEVRSLSYGAIICSIRVPDRDGRFDDVVLGHETFEGYIERSSYFGAVVGRFANRIAKGRFTLDGTTYQLATNNGANHLHGGVKGFDKKVWTAEPFENGGNVGVIWGYTSRDGEEGYPGTLTARVTYTLTANDEVIVDYDASTDKATLINLTQHTYFNLAGDGSGDILGHELTIDADAFTPVDDAQIPTGEIAVVQGTPFDFRVASTIGARIDADDEQIRRGRGYDHNFVINRSSGGLVRAALVVEPKSGRTLTVATTEPGVQLYSGNSLDGTIAGKSGHVYGRQSGLCLETQHFPDSPNHANFPSTVLRLGERFQSRTVFAFGVTSRQ